MDEPEPVWKLYERHAELWTQRRQPGVTMEQAWLDRFVHHLEPGAAVLDLGCGHGQPIAAKFLEDGFDLWGVDRAPTLIEEARKNLPDGSWHVADLSSFDLGRTFGGIIMWHSLFHLTGPEQREVFPRLAAHAEAGAPLLFTAGPAAGSAPGEFGGEALAHHSLDPDEYAQLLARVGFTVLDYRERDPECGNATVWLARYGDRDGA